MKIDKENVLLGIATIVVIYVICITGFWLYPDQAAASTQPIAPIGAESEAMQVALTAMGLEIVAVDAALNDGQNLVFQREMNRGGQYGWKTDLRWSIDTDGNVWVWYNAYKKAEP